MSELTIRPISVSDIRAASNLVELLAEYAQESAINGMPVPMPDWNLYQSLEDTGGLLIFGAYSDTQLVGFMGANLAYAAQYSATLANTMAFFVAASHRKFGTGKRLADRMTEEAFQRGASAVAIGAPSESRLAKAAEVLGFKETNRLYLRIKP